MNKYKVLIFDVDGTLLDTDEVIVQTYISLFTKYKSKNEIDINKFKTFSGPPLNETLTREFPNLDYKFIYDEYKKTSNINYPKYIKIFKNSKEVLVNLKNKGYKLAICSSKIHESIMFCLKITNLDNLFDYIVGFDDVIKPKPNNEGINKIINYFNASLNDAAFIGDTDFDYLTAKNGNLDCIIMTMLKRNNKLINKNNCTLLNSYDELESYLLNG